MRGSRSGAAWCHLCFAPAGQPAAGWSCPPARRRAPAARGRSRCQGPCATSRFQATDVTFGPVGRLVVTVLVLVPVAGFVAALFVAPIGGITGLAIWGGVIVPKALRDTWRRRPQDLR